MTIIGCKIQNLNTWLRRQQNTNYRRLIVYVIIVDCFICDFYRSTGIKTAGEIVLRPDIGIVHDHRLRNPSFDRL